MALNGLWKRESFGFGSVLPEPVDEFYVVKEIPLTESMPRLTHSDTVRMEHIANSAFWGERAAVISMSTSEGELMYFSGGNGAIKLSPIMSPENIGKYMIVYPFISSIELCIGVLEMDYVIYAGSI